MSCKKFLQYIFLSLALLSFAWSLFQQTNAINIQSIFVPIVTWAQYPRVDFNQVWLRELNWYWSVKIFTLTGWALGTPSNYACASTPQPYWCWTMPRTNYNINNVNGIISNNYIEWSQYYVFFSHNDWNWYDYIDNTVEFSAYCDLYTRAWPCSTFQQLSASPNIFYTTFVYYASGSIPPPIVAPVVISTWNNLNQSSTWLCAIAWYLTDLKKASNNTKLCLDTIDKNTTWFAYFYDFLQNWDLIWYDTTKLFNYYLSSSSNFTSVCSTAISSRQKFIYNYWLSNFRKWVALYNNDTIYDWIWEYNCDSSYFSWQIHTWDFSDKPFTITWFTFNDFSWSVAWTWIFQNVTLWSCLVWLRNWTITSFTDSLVCYSKALTPDLTKYNLSWLPVVPACTASSTLTFWDVFLYLFTMFLWFRIFDILFWNNK